jgi:hypothetical protein
MIELLAAPEGQDIQGRFLRLGSMIDIREVE